MQQKTPYGRMFPHCGPARGQCPQGGWRGNEPVCPRPGHSYYPPARPGRFSQENQGRRQEAWHTGAWQQPMPRREQWQEETGPSDPILSFRRSRKRRKNRWCRSARNVRSAPLSRKRRKNQWCRSARNVRSVPPSRKHRKNQRCRSVRNIRSIPARPAVLTLARLAASQ